WLHGGAFSLGDLDASDAWCAQISDRVGAVVVNVDYRLAPEHPYPAGLTDSYAALEWLTSPAGHLGVDAARIAVAGSSAGGCLAAGVALLARDREGPAIRHQLLIYPVLDDRCATASARHAVDVPVFTAASNRTMWEVYLAGGPVDGYAAPARAENLSELPSAFVLAAQHDPLLDEAIEYAGRLAAAGVRVDLRVAAGAFHGFDAVVPHAAVSRRAQDACLGALARELARDVSREPVEAACARR
ncbi:MAG TPA: alpha/beta hydrolase, partial [Streptomyces sp.]